MIVYSDPEAAGCTPRADEPGELALERNRWATNGWVSLTDPSIAMSGFPTHKNPPVKSILIG